MISFTPRDPETATRPDPGSFSLIMTLAGELALLDAQGGAFPLAFAAPVEIDEEVSADIVRRRFISGLVDGSTLAAGNVVGREPPASAFAPGYRGMPTIAHNGAYTFALPDAGICIANLAGGWTIPANSAVPFPLDTMIMIRNDSASTQTLAITSDTLRLAGDTLTAARTIAAYGVATIYKVAASEWRCWGNLT